MQIREIGLKELDLAFGALSLLHKSLSYDEFEELVYDMREMKYRMLGILENEEIVCCAGVSVLTTLKQKRHLRVFDFVVLHDDVLKYKKLMDEFLCDYAKMAACQSVVFDNIGKVVKL